MRQGPDPRPLLLLVESPSAIRYEPASRYASSRADHNLPYVYVTVNILVIFITNAVCVLIFMDSPNGLGPGLLSILGGLFTFFKCMSFWSHGCCGEWEGWARKQLVNHNSWMAVVTQTYRSKSIRNRSVMEVFGGVFVLSLCLNRIFVGIGAFVIGPSKINRSISLIISLEKIKGCPHLKCTNYLFLALFR